MEGEKRSDSFYNLIFKMISKLLITVSLALFLVTDANDSKKAFKPVDPTSDT